MQRLLDRTEVRDRLTVEIRWITPPAPRVGAELRGLDVSLLEVSRLLCFSRPCDLTQDALDGLLDPRLERLAAPEECDRPYVDVFCLPGVTDAEGEMAGLALSLAGIPDVSVRAGTRYHLAADVPPSERPRVERVVGNSVIHCFRWDDDSAPEDEPDVDETVGAPRVEQIDLRGLERPALLELSARHGLVLDAAEMTAIQRAYATIGRAPTDVELQSIALAWSEHCSHKTFKAPIEMTVAGQTERIDGLLHDCIVEPSRSQHRWWVRSGFADNAGVIALDASHDLAIKVETHNHPSAIEPFGGAHTGVGGVIRDVLAMSAEPIANLDVLCFAPPDTPQESVPAGAVHPAVTMREVVRGVADYGNNMGIPTVGGAIYFHPDYAANPLVFCGTLGITPHGAHPRTPATGDLVVVLGGRTGRDGLHGATMSSATLEREAVAASTVQIGDPIREKTVRDVLPALRDERLYSAITDCGAGGLCSAVGEMGEEIGVEVDLALVPLKYRGLAPWEIWLSEAQERMVLAVPSDNLPRLHDLCAFHGVEATVIGRFRDDGHLLLRYGDTLVAELETRFLHRGRPVSVLPARWDPPQSRASLAGEREDHAETLLHLLADGTIGSKESVVRRYDHEVGARTAIGPLVGNAGPSDGVVLRPLENSPRGVVIGLGMAPRATALDPYGMAFLAVDEALRNLVAAGGSIGRAALLDNFCWGDVDDPVALGTLVRAAQGCRDAAMRYRVPFISGKDSLRNTSTDATGRHSIPGTLVITAIGVVPNAGHCVTMAPTGPGDTLYLLGTTDGALGGSYHASLRGSSAGDLPRARPETAALMRRLTRAMRRGLISACHDLSEGGLAVAAAEMAIAGGVGISLDLCGMPAETDDLDALLFCETPGRFLLTVCEADRSRFERCMGAAPLAPLGETTREQRVLLRHGRESAIDLPLTAVEAAWRGAL